MMGAAEIVEKLVSPAEKLIDAVSGAIGKAYEPRYIRKIADSKAYELQVIADTVRNNSDVPIVYNPTGVSIDTSDYEALAKRASSRLAYQEIAKQQNMEAVADIAYEELNGTTMVSDEPINRDWMTRLFNSVEDISNEDMQKIWGCILAGEIKAPNTYSYRTLEKLRNMTQYEAQLFQKVASLALQYVKNIFLLGDKRLLHKYDIYYSDILKLDECGLMNATELSFKLDVSSTHKSAITYHSQYVGVIQGTKGDNMQELRFSGYAFTESGRQLLQALHPQIDRQIFIDSIQSIRKGQSDFHITAHVLDKIEDSMEQNRSYISYDEENILPPE